MRSILLALLAITARCAAEEVTLSSAQDFASTNLVEIRSVVPDIALEIRYAGDDNFVGRPIDGYDAPKCFLHREAAAALGRVEGALRERNLRLKIFDCYRPVRAVMHFMRWAQDPNDQRTKSRYYPQLDKSQLVGEYIAPVSGHSRGATLDLTLLTCDRTHRDCVELDMGTPYDFFDERAHTDHASMSAQQRTNRRTLEDAMTRAGFENYAAEWWHYTFKPEPTPTVQFDIIVR